MNIKMLTRLKHVKYGIIENQKCFDIDSEYGKEFVKNGWAEKIHSSKNIETDSDVEAEGQEALLKSLKKKKQMKDNLIKINVKGEEARQVMAEKSNSTLGEKMTEIKIKVSDLKEKIAPKRIGRPPKK